MGQCKNAYICHDLDFQDVLSDIHASVKFVKVQHSG